MKIDIIDDYAIYYSTYVNAIVWVIGYILLSNLRTLAKQHDYDEILRRKKKYSRILRACVVIAILSLFASIRMYFRHC